MGEQRVPPAAVGVKALGWRSSARRLEVGELTYSIGLSKLIHGL